MKKMLLTLSAIAAFSGVRAQAIEVHNTTSCTVIVMLRAFYQNKPCTLAGGIYMTIPAMSSVTGLTQLNFSPPPPFYPGPLLYDGSPIEWGMAHVGVSNPSYGYEPNTTVGDGGITCTGSSISPFDAWYNPTCGITQNITFTPGSPTVPASLTIN